MNKKYNFLIFFFFFAYLLHAQKETDKIKIAVVDFTTAHGLDFKDTINLGPSLREMVSNEFVERTGFVILDRGLFSKVTEALDLETGESFLNSKIAETGRLYGAQYIVTGLVTRYNEVKNSEVVTDEIVDSRNPKNIKYVKRVQYTYTINISFSLKSIDVTTGQLVFSEAINTSSTGDYPNDALNYAYFTIGCRLKYEMMRMFPVEIHLIKLDEIDKKGRLKKVMIDKGDELFSGKISYMGRACIDGGKPDVDHSLGESVAIILGKNTGALLSVVLVDVLTVNGKDYSTEKEIGKLEVKQIEGPVSICLVKEGDKEIMESFNNGKKLKIKFL